MKRHTSLSSALAAAVLVVTLAGSAFAADNASKPPKAAKVCADGCYSHCVKRVEQKLTANVPGCQRSCQRSHKCNG